MDAGIFRQVSLTRLKFFKPNLNSEYLLPTRDKTRGASRDPRYFWFPKILLPRSAGSALDVRRPLASSSHNLSFSAASCPRLSPEKQLINRNRTDTFLAGYRPRHSTTTQACVSNTRLAQFPHAFSLVFREPSDGVSGGNEQR